MHSAGGTSSFHGSKGASRYSNQKSISGSKTQNPSQQLAESQLKNGHRNSIQNQQQQQLISNAKSPKIAASMTRPKSSNGHSQA